MSDAPIIDHTKTKDKVGWRWLHKSGPLTAHGNVPPKCSPMAMVFPKIAPQFILGRLNYLIEVLDGKDLTVAFWKVLSFERDFLSERAKWMMLPCEDCVVNPIIAEVPSSDLQNPTP